MEALVRNGAPYAARFPLRSALVCARTDASNANRGACRSRMKISRLSCA